MIEKLEEMMDYARDRRNESKERLENTLNEYKEHVNSITVNRVKELLDPHFGTLRADYEEYEKWINICAYMKLEIDVMKKLENK